MEKIENKLRKLRTHILSLFKKKSRATKSALGALEVAIAMVMAELRGLDAEKRKLERHLQRVG